MTDTGLSITECLKAMGATLGDAVAITRAAVTCAENGAEREAVRIAMDVDDLLHEAEALHGAMRLISRRSPDGGFARPLLSID